MEAQLQFTSQPTDQWTTQLHEWLTESERGVSGSELVRSY